MAGEFPGGGEYQSAQALAAFSEEPVEQREGEGRRLASAGLSQAEHVTAVEAGGNSFDLNWPGSCKAGDMDAAYKGFVESELVECGRGD